MLAILDHTDIAARAPARPAGLVPVRAGEPPDVRRPRPLRRRPALRAVPVERLLDPAYVRAARAADRHARRAARPQPGEIRAAARPRHDPRVAGTSHFVVVDADGNVVSMTTTVESVFGSGRTVGGFVLNNQLTDFSFVPTEDGRPVANAVQGGKRPRSSMAPIIVLDHAGDFVAALGSPGGRRSWSTTPRRWWRCSPGRCRSSRRSSCRT